MSFDYKYVINPSGQIDNHILKEMFEDISLNINDIPVDQIDSESATDGHVLTADGSGGSAFEALSSIGTVKQVVVGTTTTYTSTTSTSYADTTLTATITPTSSTSKILVLVSQNYLKIGNGTVLLKGLRGSTNLGEQTAVYINDLASSASTVSSLTASMWWDSPATTNATIYKTQFRLRVSGGTGAVNNDGAFSGSNSITLIEIAQ